MRASSCEKAPVRGEEDGMAPLVPKDGGRMDAGCGVWGGAAGPAIPGQCPPRITLDAVGAFLQEQWH